MRHHTIHGITTSNTIRRIRKNIYRHKNGNICEDKNCVTLDCIKSGIVWGFSNRKDNSKIQGFSSYKNRQIKKRVSKDVKEENYENEIFYNEENDDDYSNEVFSSSSEEEIPEEINLYNEKEEINLYNDDYLEEDEFKHYRIQLDNEYEKLTTEWIIINKDQLNI